MQLNHIIVATDFSAHSDTALRHGIRIARATGAELRIIHVVETPADEEGLESARPAVEHWHDDGQGRLAQAIEPYASEDVDIAQEVVDAPSTAEGLELIIDARPADLVIVGSTGLTGIKQTLLGSTAQKVLRTVQTHIMVARGEPPPASGYKRILIPTDFSGPAEKALELAVVLAAPDAQFDVVHFWRVPEATRGDEYSDLVIDTVAASVKKRGRKLIESFQGQVANATFHSVQASPQHGLAEKLDEVDYDLVVVGSAGRSKLRRWLLGSVAEHTARIAPCAVAVARPDS